MACVCVSFILNGEKGVGLFGVDLPAAFLARFIQRLSCCLELLSRGGCYIIGRHHITHTLFRSSFCGSTRRPEMSHSLIW